MHHGDGDGNLVGGHAVAAGVAVNGLRLDEVVAVAASEESELAALVGIHGELHAGAEAHLVVGSAEAVEGSLAEGTVRIFHIAVDAELAAPQFLGLAIGFVAAVGHALAHAADGRHLGRGDFLGGEQVGIEFNLDAAGVEVGYVAAERLVALAVLGGFMRVSFGDRLSAEGTLLVGVIDKADTAI